MAPNCGGQCRMQVSQLMHSAISMKRGRFFHFGLRSRDSSRSGRVAAGIEDYVTGVPPSDHDDDFLEEAVDEIDEDVETEVSSGIPTYGEVPVASVHGPDLTRS